MKFFKDEDGSTGVEYSILAVSIAAVIVTVVTSIGVNVASLFQSVIDKWI